MSRAPTANPTRRPAIAYAFDAVRTDTTFGNLVRSGMTEARTNSLYASSTTTAGAGRPSAAASVAIPSSSVSIAPSGSGRPVGLFGLHTQTRVASRAAARTAGTSIAQPSAFDRRGTAMTRAPRCSAWTRYMA